jgi:hypothetical protein
MHPAFLFPRLKTKLKGRHFDTTRVIQAESQALLNSLTQHDFPEAFKTNGRSAGNCAYARKGTTSRSVGSKLIFGQMAAPVPEIMDESLYDLGSTYQIMNDSLFHMMCVVELKCK